MSRREVIEGICLFVATLFVGMMIGHRLAIDEQGRAKQNNQPTSAEHGVESKARK